MSYSKSFGILLLCALLVSCGGSDQQEEEQEADTGILQVSGAKSSALIASTVSKGGFGFVLLQRPTAPTGVFTSMFLSQGEFLPSNSAIMGVESQVSLIRGQEKVDTDETFSLLQEFGNILQVDITDMLNRSNDREETLNQYLTSLKDTGGRMERRKTELDERLDIVKKNRVNQRKIVRDRNREMENALRDEDYVLAGSLQERLSAEEGTLAEIETEERLSTDIIDRYKDLLKIGQERYNAILKNREVLIAGVRVVDVPGIDDLDILYKETYRRRSENLSF